MTKEIVVAYYNENLDWLKKVKEYKITIYNKSSLDIDNTISLPNIGREMHTYFHHIVENYDTLSDWIFFTQGNPFDHVKDYMDILNGFPESLTVHSKLSSNESYFFSNGSIYNEHLISYGDGTPTHRGLDINGTWSFLFDTKHPDEYKFVAGCIFCVSKKQIHLKEKTFYEKCKEITENKSSSPWEFERMMYHIF